MEHEQIDRPAALLPSTERHGSEGNDRETETAQRAPARLVEFDQRKFVALPVHTTLEIVAQPDIIPVPGALYYGLGMLRWQGRYLAVLDLGTLLNAHPRDGAAPPIRHALVVAYQKAPRQPVEYAAIATVGLPQTVQVGDDMQCPLPGSSDLWPLIAVSCFSHQGVPVPIVDTGRLFATFWS